MANAKSLGTFVKSPLTFIKESRDELKKVTWPSRAATIRYTLIVIIGSIVVGFVTGAIDYVFTKILQSLIL